MIIIKNESEFNKWFYNNDCGYFLDGHALELFPVAKPGQPISKVRLKLGCQIEGTNEAGTLATYKVYTLHATGVKLWTYNEDTNYSAAHCMEYGIDILHDDEELLFIRLDVPEFVSLKCAELLVEDPVIVQAIIEPQLNSNEIYAYVPKLNIPSPCDWVEWLYQEGLEVAWRFAEGEATQPGKVPYPDYTGWFLQERERISSTKFGIFFRQLSKEPIYFFQISESALIHGFYINLENKDSDSNKLWQAVTKIIATWRNVQIRSGNCNFTGEQWICYLKDGSLPLKVSANSEEIKDVGQAPTTRKFDIRSGPIGNARK